MIEISRHPDGGYLGVCTGTKRDGDCGARYWAATPTSRCSHCRTKEPRADRQAAERSVGFRGGSRRASAMPSEASIRAMYCVDSRTPR